MCNEPSSPDWRVARRRPEPRLDEKTCYLCGLPLGNRETREGVPLFCCPGCRQVFLVLAGASGELPHNFRDTDLYRACMDAGIIPGKEALKGQSEEKGADETGTSFLGLDFRLEGMWCPACAWVIEEVLKRTPGVSEPRVSFFSDTVRLQYLPHLVSPAEIISHVDKLGYRAYSGDCEGLKKGILKEDLLIRLGISSILAINAMMLSWVLYSGFVRDLTPTVIAYFSYPLLAMATPVVFYGGWPILRKAWINLRYGHIAMDTLISVSVLSAFFYSLIRMIEGSIHLYFDTAAMLVAIVLLGRFVESRTREHVAGMIALDETGLRKARLVAGTWERWVDADAMLPGDRFIVRKGERIPLDGSITKGEGLLDQSAFTGEPVSVAKGPGEDVMAGSLLIDGSLEITATKTSRESGLRQMIELMAEALERKSPGEELADSVSRLFVPSILFVAAMTAMIMWTSGSTGDQILLRCLTILLVSCPCALGIAVPLVKAVILGLGKKQGILIVRPEALKEVESLDTIVFDKTGTVTEGAFTLRHIVCDGLSEEEALCVIGAVEARSSHFLAAEIRRHLRSIDLKAKEAQEVVEMEGMGVTGIVEGKAVFVGNRRLIEHSSAEPPHLLDQMALTYEEEGMTVIFFGWGKKVHGFLVFGDPLKKGARETVTWLTQRGIKVFLVSGDGQRTTEAMAGLLGIADYMGQQLPAQKVQAIKDLQSRGHRVGMVGDGINDAGALAQGDVGFAVGPGYAVTHEASDLVIPSGRIETLKRAFELSTLSDRTIKQNLALAFLYNGVAVPVAALGFLNPLIAVCAMCASSIAVIGNGLRINRKRMGNRLFGERDDSAGEIRHGGVPKGVTQ